MTYKKKQSYINTTAWQNIILFFFVVAALIIYIPILVETYLNLGIFTGPEELFISNHRDSHMLGFALPMITGPLLILAVIKTFNDRVDFENLYRFVNFLTWIVVIFSLIRYVIQIEFIPQSYLESIRNDGFRLSGFNQPDSIGYGKMLIIPLGLTLSYSMSKLKSHKDVYLLFFILISLFLTYSRIIIASSIFILLVIALYNFKIAVILKSSLYLFVVFAIIFFSGGIEKLTSRSTSSTNVSGINMSGRDLIYETGIPIVAASPYVGLRPGGYVSMLQKGYYYTSQQGYTGLMVVQSAHSFYLVIALEWGLPLLCFIIVIMLHCIYLLHLTIRLTSKYSFFEGFPSIRIWSVAVIALIVGLLILGITDFISYPFIFFLIGLSWSLYLIVKKTVFQHLRLTELNHTK